MRSQGAQSLNRLLDFHPQTSQNHIIYSDSDNNFHLTDVNKYTKLFAANRIEVHNVFFNGCNLYIDIDTLNKPDWERAVKACKRLKKVLFTKMNNVRCLLVGYSPYSLHFHAQGIWFDSPKDIPSYLKMCNFPKEFIDSAVYKNNAKLRLGYRTNSNHPERKYEVLSTYRQKLSLKDFLEIASPGIFPNTLLSSSVIRQYERPIENKEVLDDLTIDEIKDYLLNIMGIRVVSMSVSGGGEFVSIIPEKPWFCEIHNRVHHSNNLFFRKGRMCCYLKE